MVPFSKYYSEDGNKVAVLYSPGFGAGWYTWNVDFENNNHYYGLLFDKNIVEMLIKGEDDSTIIQYCESHYGKEGCYIGVEDLTIKWLDCGEKFRIQEYDGNETIETITETIWLEA